MATLSVLLHKCADICAVDEGESGEPTDVTSNAYAQLSLPGLAKQKSRTVRGTLDPTFDEQFEFDVSGMTAQQLTQIKLKLVVRHQPSPERERGSADPYLGRADISVAELLARHGDEAAAVGDEVSGTEDTWPLSDPAFKVKSKHLRNRTRRHANQQPGDRSPLRRRHPYGTVQLWAEYLPATTPGPAPSATAAPPAPAPQPEPEPAAEAEPDQEEPPPAAADGTAFDELEAGMLAALGGETPLPATAASLPADAAAERPSGAELVRDALSSAFASVQEEEELQQAGLSVQDTPPPASLSPEQLASLAPSPLSPSAEEARHLAQEILGDLSQPSLSEEARNARQLAADILTQHTTDLEDSHSQMEHLRSDALAAVDVEREVGLMM